MDTVSDQIIEIATKLFQQRGIRNVTIDEVCAELRISKKTFYSHFAQKEDLVESVIMADQNQNLDKTIKNLKNKNAIDSLIYIVKELKKNSECQPYMLWYDVQKYYPKIFEKFVNLRNELVKNGFEKNILQGIAEGYYREDLDIELTSLFHMIQIKNSFELMEQSAKKYSKKRILDFFIDLMMHLIVNERGLKYLNENYHNDIKSN
jgi:AcrR family transcriptional regulator